MTAIVAAPVVVERAGAAVTTSRDVAAFFGKKHRNVLAAIDAMLAAEPSLSPLTFKQGVYRLPETADQDHRCFEMTRDGFTLLAMGFTGAKALAFKLRYIGAFNAIEAQLKARAQLDPAALLNDPAALRNLLLGASDRQIALESEVAALKPEADALKRLAGASGSYCVTDAAKMLQISPRELSRWLQAHAWIYRRPTGRDWLAYQSKLQPGWLVHKVSSFDDGEGQPRTRVQVRVTAAGLAILAKRLVSK